MIANQSVSQPSPANSDPIARGSSAEPADNGHDPFTTVAAVIALEPRQCRWPNGVPGHSGFHFCGARTAVGESYCAEHLRRSLHRSERRTPEALYRLNRAQQAAVMDGGRSDALAVPAETKTTTSRSRLQRQPRQSDVNPPVPQQKLARGVLQRQLFDFLRRQPRGVDLAPARDIAQQLDLKPETVRGQLSRFEARGWIRRQPFDLLHDPTAAT